MRNRYPRPPALWIVKGARADYHSVIGAEVTVPNVEILTDPSIIGSSWVVWVKGVRGCVACDALSPAGTIEEAASHGHGC